MIHPDMQLRLSFRPYRRKFALPLRVAWGNWHLREGIVLKLEDLESGLAGYGEIAPLEPFGTESLEKALRHIFALNRSQSAADLGACMSEAPAATAFGLNSALRCLQDGDSETNPTRTAALVDLNSLDAKLGAFRLDGTTVFKVKLGIQPPGEEQSLLDAVLAELKPGELLRLDPNESWDLEIWETWLAWLERAKEHIQYIEEPFSPELLSTEELLGICGNSPVPFALDESLSRGGIEPWMDVQWPGYWIIKPSLMGDPANWLSQLQDCDNVVLSSAFETGIGMSSIIRLAGKLDANAHGLGTCAYFEDDIGIQPKGSALTALTRGQMESIWNNLPDD